MNEASTPPMAAAVGRNDPCPCGSGFRFKNCCLPRRSGAPVISLARTVAPEIAAHLATIKRLGAEGRWPDTIPALREITRLDPGSAEAHHDLGVTLLRCGQPAEAVPCLRRAVELRPGFRRALSSLAEALNMCGQGPEAADFFRRAGDAAENAVDQHVFMARALLWEDRLPEAEAELDRAISTEPNNAFAHHQLGLVLSQTGRLDRAHDHFARAIALSPDEPLAFYDWAISRRATADNMDLLARVEEVAGRRGQDMTLRINLHFGLGKAFDDLGNAAAAIAHFDRGNLLKATMARLDRERLAKQFGSQIAGFTEPGLARAARDVARPRHEDDDLPVFILGMPRSGTTLVEQILSSHPEVSAGGELQFWLRRLNAWTASGQGRIDAGAIALAANEYLALLRRIGPNALRVTDKAPGNFERIYLLRLAVPDARIIHCRRNPVDTCLSIYFTHFYGNLDYAYDRGDLVFYYRQYERLMEHWRQVLPPDRFIEVEYEQVIADREATTRRLVEFCGLPWDDRCLAPERNTRSVKTASVWQARQPVYATSVERWRRYEPWLGELRELLRPAP